MNDNQRLRPVDEFVIHHSAGNRMIGWTDLQIQDSYSETGRWRGYNGGVENGGTDSCHEHPSRPGVKTYAQAQYAGVQDSSNKYNYRIVTLIARPWDNVAWHCGNWGHNQKSIGIENCGDFTNMYLEDRQLMCIADFYRPKDTELKGNTAIFGHQEISPTSCPAKIMEERDKLVDMVNNPAKWNATLFPPAPPKPVITTKEEITTEHIPFTIKDTGDPTLPENEVKVSVQGVDGVVTLVTTVTYTDGKETSRVAKTRTITTQPIEQIVLHGTKKPVIPDDNTNFITWLKNIFVAISNFLTSWRK